MGPFLLEPIVCLKRGRAPPADVEFSRRMSATMNRAPLAATACLLASALLTACTAAPEPPPYKPLASVKDLMEATVQPAADVYWKSVSTTVTRDGVEEKFPKTDVEWEAVWAAAVTIAESGNLMMMPSRAKENDPEWLKLSAALVDAGDLAAKAALSKNPERVLEQGEKVYDVCTNCHRKYITDPADTAAQR